MSDPVSLQSKLKAIRDAGFSEPPFPYNELPREYKIDIAGVPKMAHKPAGDHRARQQRIETWLRDVDETWKRLPQQA